jgi:hypothetical protein
MLSEGFAAAETKAAFARAVELAERSDDFLERLAALVGQWAGAITGGELRSAQQLALALLGEGKDAAGVTETGIVSWMLGLIDYFRGDFVEARTHCQRALDACYDPKVWERLTDVRVAASSYLGAAMWQLGEVNRARELIDGAIRHASEFGHIPAIVDALFWRSYLDVWRGDPLATLRAAEALRTIALEHGLAVSASSSASNPV